VQKEATTNHHPTQQPGQQRQLPAGRRLLLVDDDAPLRKNLVRAFEREGFEVATAGVLREAYEVAGEFGPDFAVVDLNLQDGYGMELVTALQQLKPGVRVVILTGYDSIASSLVALKAGAVGYLAKPVQPEQVIAALLGEPDGGGRPGRAADVGGPGALGAHPARVRAVQPERLRDRAPPQHAPAHPAADPSKRAPRP
jgi:two-component system response regulator RegA